uniref:Uncharacterized protein n=1 Tax=Cannabis sativa TaxID=3483 RepID=A0A803NXD0_CANSA
MLCTLLEFRTWKKRTRMKSSGIPSKSPSIAYVSKCHLQLSSWADNVVPSYSSGPAPRPQFGSSVKSQVRGSRFEFGIQILVQCRGRGHSPGLGPEPGVGVGIEVRVWDPGLRFKSSLGSNSGLDLGPGSKSSSNFGPSWGLGLRSESGSGSGSGVWVRVKIRVPMLRLGSGSKITIKKKNCFKKF